MFTSDEMKELEIALGISKPEAPPEPPQLVNHRLKQGRFSDDEVAQIAAALGG
jgi:hypothetical protein